MRKATPNVKWGVAWIGMTVAIALHVVDELATGFLPAYNAVVTAMRESYAWFPLPTLSFAAWITGLGIGITVMFLLTPFVFAARRWLRPVAFFLSVLMVANALGHMAISLYIDSLAPGVFSSPVVLLAAIALFVTTYRLPPDLEVEDVL